MGLLFASKALAFWRIRLCQGGSILKITTLQAKSVLSGWLASLQTWRKCHFPNPTTNGTHIHPCSTQGTSLLECLSCSPSSAVNPKVMLAPKRKFELRGLMTFNLNAAESERDQLGTNTSAGRDLSLGTNTSAGRDLRDQHISWT